MAAYDRLVNFFIEKHRMHDTGIDAFTAADAFLRSQQDTAARPIGQRTAGARLHTGRVMASNADDRYKSTGHSAGSFDFDRALGQ